MPTIKRKRIGNYEITKYPKAIWVRSLPYGRNLKKFKTFTAAEKYAHSKK